MEKTTTQSLLPPYENPFIDRETQKHHYDVNAVKAYGHNNKETKRIFQNIRNAILVPFGRFRIRHYRSRYNERLLSAKKSVCYAHDHNDLGHKRVTDNNIFVHSITPRQIKRKIQMRNRMLQKLPIPTYFNDRNII